MSGLYAHHTCGTLPRRLCCLSDVLRAVMAAISVAIGASATGVLEPAVIGCVLGVRVLVRADAWSDRGGDAWHDARRRPCPCCSPDGSPETGDEKVPETLPVLEKELVTPGAPMLEKDLVTPPLWGDLPFRDHCTVCALMGDLGAEPPGPGDPGRFPLGMGRAAASRVRRRGGCIAAPAVGQRDMALVLVVGLPFRPEPNPLGCTDWYLLIGDPSPNFGESESAVFADFVPGALTHNWSNGEVDVGSVHLFPARSPS